jgi:pimeloyl-ACP methyl ester carboxylesterase
VPLVVGIHGAPGTVFDFRYLGPALCASRLPFFLRLGQPGHGAVPLGDMAGLDAVRPRAFAEANERNLRTILSAPWTQRSGPTVLVGHSIGGAVALQMMRLALERGEDLSRVGVVLVNPIGLRTHKGLRPEVLMRLFAFLAPRATPFAWWSKTVLTKILGFPARTSVAESVLTMRRAAGIHFGDQHAAVRALQATDVARRPKIHVALADDDPIVEAPIVRELADALHASVFHVPTGGHYLPKFACRDIASDVAHLVRTISAQTSE